MESSVYGKNYAALLNARFTCGLNMYNADQITKINITIHMTSPKPPS
jgi:hypothetical protein